MSRRGRWRGGWPASDATYPGSVLATNLKVSGVSVFSAGDFLGATAGADEIVLNDPGLGVYKKLVIANGRLIGAVLFGDTSDGLLVSRSHALRTVHRRVCATTWSSAAQPSPGSRREARHGRGIALPIRTHGTR